MSLLETLNLTVPAGLLQAATGASTTTGASKPAPKPTARPATAAKKKTEVKKKTAAEPSKNVNNYIALVNGIDHEVVNAGHQKAIDVSPSDPNDLIGRHRGLLAALHAAIAQVRVPKMAGGALAVWQSIESELRSEVVKSTKVEDGLTTQQINGALEQLGWLDKKWFTPAAYWEAKRDAETQSDLEAPDTAQMAPKLARAERELEEAKKVFEESLKLAAGTGKLAGLEAPGQVKEIVELVMLKGTIEEKLEAARKAGIASTAAELVAKVTSATGAFLETSSKIGKAVVGARKAFILAKGATKAGKEAVEQLEKLLGKFEKLEKVSKSIAKAGSYAAVIADYVKLITAIANRDYGEIASSAANLAVDAAPLLLGQEVAGPLAVITVVVQAELAAISMAAAFIRWCKDETVREAALDFINDCNKVAKGGAISLVADCKLLLGEANPSVQAIALEQANREAAAVSRGLRALASHVTATAPDAIGHYPLVVASLGTPALQAMTVVFDENDGVLMVAQQIADVFHGANEMAKFVKSHYTN